MRNAQGAMFFPRPDNNDKDAILSHVFRRIALNSASISGS